MKKQNIIYILLFLIVSLFAINVLLVKADSGWDTSYDSWDSGSSWDSWDSGSSWDSWDSWDSGSSWSYSSGSHRNYGSQSPGMVLFTFLIFFVVIGIIAHFLQTYNKNYLSSPKHYNIDDYETTNHYLDKHLVALSKIKEERPYFDEDAFNDLVFDMFVKIQNAWSDFDYEELKKHLTDELYNTYNSQLKILKAKNEKNVMSDFTKELVQIIDFKVEGGLYNAQVLFNSKFYDYIINNHDVVLRGKNNIKVDMTYILTFVKTPKAATNNCPNCGAKLGRKAINNCPYCKSKIISHSYDWILSKKEAINQRWD